MEIEKHDIEIQKDVGNFKEEILFGLDFKQLMHVVAGSVLAIALYMLFRFIGIPYIKELLIVIIVTPIFVAGFFKYQGLTLREFIENILEFYKRKKVIVYQDYNVEELIGTEGTNE